MDTSQSLSKYELYLLWNRKSKRYNVKSFTENGHWITHLVLNDNCTGGTVIGKLVKRSSEEFHQRPHLHHRNLASLIDMVTIQDDLSVFISVYQQKTLRDIVHEKTFVQSSNCFALKKIYIEDVLWGLDYLHRRGLCLMNLTDANVFICEQPSKAIITDFECLTQVGKEGEYKFDVPFVHLPPEIRMKSAKCDLIAAEMWVTGMMVMDIFTQHKLTWTLVDYDPDSALEMIAKVDYELLVIANQGSTLTIQDLGEFKAFISLFIDGNPQRRCSAREAISTIFLGCPKYNASLQKTVSSSNNASEMNEIVSIPSVYQFTSNLKHDSKNNNGFRALNTSRSYSDENKKAKSNLSLKECVKQINSHLQSHDIQKPSFEDLGNTVVPDSTQNIIDGCTRKSESMVDMDSSQQGERIPVSKEFPETTNFYNARFKRYRYALPKNKVSPKNAAAYSKNPDTFFKYYFLSPQTSAPNKFSKNPFTISETRFSSTQEFKDNNVSSIISEALTEEVVQYMYKQLEQITEQNRSLVNNIKTQNMCVSEFEQSSNQSSENASKFVAKMIPYVQPQNLPPSKFKHINQPPVIVTKFVLPKNKISIKDTLEVHEKEYSCDVKDKEVAHEKENNSAVEDTKEVHEKVNHITLNDTKYVPEKDNNSIVDDTKDVPEKVSCSVANNIKEVPEKENNSAIDDTKYVLDKEHKNTVDDTKDVPEKENNSDGDDPEGVSEKEDQLQKVVIIHSITEKYIFKVEPEQKERGKYMIKKVESDDFKKCMTFGKKIDHPITSTECTVAEDSTRDE